MSERQIINRMRSLEELETQKKALKTQITALKKEIQESMRDQETVTAGHYIIRWTKTVSERFDSSSFKESHKRLYSRFLKPVESRRFTYSVAE